MTVSTHTSSIWRFAVLAFVLLGAVVASGASAGALDTTPDLPVSRGDSGDAVRSTQLLLTTAGFDPGPIDGIFGPATEAAVENLQRDAGLPVTGVVDATTWAALEAATPAILVQRGDRGDDVRTLQQLLTGAGFDAGVIDGVFGPLTENAVESFQSDAGLPITGLVDQVTWDALRSDPPAILMERGDRGQDVRSLQLLLASAGNNPGPIDGIFGGLTESAVVAFQTSHGLPVTGQVDQATLDALTDVADEPATLYESGDTGPQVEAIQDQLATVGFDPGPIDAIFGSKTARAVTRFHSVFGLAGEGSVTQQTLDKLAELVPLAETAYDYGYDPDEGPEQWRALITGVFSQIGLDQEKCGTGDRSGDCLGSQIDNAIVIMTCESSGIPMAVNYSSGTTGLFQHRPVFWADRVARAQDLFPTLPADATPYNPEHNIMVAAMLVHESRDALLGYTTLAGPWDDGPEPWGHWDGSSRYCADPPLVIDS
jgi:peptidoglycan hydrolase-like protein with peptidoglycan-binding domain